MIFSNPDTSPKKSYVKILLYRPIFQPLNPTGFPTEKKIITMRNDLFLKYRNLFLHSSDTESPDSLKISWAVSLSGYN